MSILHTSLRCATKTLLPVGIEPTTTSDNEGNPPSSGPSGNWNIFLSHGLCVDGGGLRALPTELREGYKPGPHFKPLNPVQTTHSNVMGLKKLHCNLCKELIASVTVTPTDRLLDRAA